MEKRMVALLIGVVLSTQIHAQTSLVVPRGMSGMPTTQIGNMTRCDGKNPNGLELTVIPSCYGKNLRGGGHGIKANGGDIKMELSLYNPEAKTQRFKTSFSFPVKAAWPDYYGQACDYVESSKKVTCMIEESGVVKAVHYDCSLQKGANVTLHRLTCFRKDDPFKHNDLNRKIECSFFTTWDGAGKAAKDSYHIVQGKANCGLREKDENFGELVKLDPTVSAKSSTRFAERGRVIVSLDKINYPHRGVLLDNRTNSLVLKRATQVSLNFTQGGKPVAHHKSVTSNEYEDCQEINVSFLGENQFCGSYYSPLMLFFDDKMPAFASISSFPLLPGVKRLYWPEKKHPGYFLALDTFKNGKILSGKQLFGEDGTNDNGFEALRKHDSNQDGKIDSSDPVFKELVLWNDKNSNGISDNGEVNRLEEKGVSSIALGYENDSRTFISFGQRAQARQSSTFIRTDGGSGKVVDIWLAPVSK